MRSKEEILKKGTFEGDFYDYMAEHRVKRAMDVYAKEVAIDFHKWCLKNKLFEFLNKPPIQTLAPDLTAEQLFEKYLSEKQNIK